jgi:hypothetical protein
MKSRLPFLTGLLALSVLRIAAAQQAADQLAFQPPTPGPEHARLKKMEGTWDAVMKMSDGKSSKGEAVYKMECGGLWLASDFKGSFEGAPFHGKGLDTYDAAKKKHIAVWVDSMMTSPLVMEGTRDEATKTTTQMGECPGPDGKLVKMKGVTKEIDNDHLTFEMYLVLPDGKEAKQMTIEYARRK